MSTAEKESCSILHYNWEHPTLLQVIQCMVTAWTMSGSFLYAINNIPEYSFGSSKGATKANPWYNKPHITNIIVKPTNFVFAVYRVYIEPKMASTPSCTLLRRLRRRMWYLQSSGRSSADIIHGLIVRLEWPRRPIWNFWVLTLSCSDMNMTMNVIWTKL